MKTLGKISLALTITFILFCMLMCWGLRDCANHPEEYYQIGIEQIDKIIE